MSLTPVLSVLAGPEALSSAPIIGEGAVSTTAKRGLGAMACQTAGFSRLMLKPGPGWQPFREKAALMANPRLAAVPAYQLHRFTGVSADRPAPKSYLRVSYEGRALEVFAIAVVNAILTLFTLGVYRFWARTRLRRYLWSRVTLSDEPFEYTGTGLQLFLGFLIVLLISVPLLISAKLIQAAYADDPRKLMASVTGLTFFVVNLINVAIFRARRYRLSHTNWRGIRCGQSGSSITYMMKALAYSLFTLITLGLGYPLMRTWLQEYLTNNTWFGDRRFNFHGRASDLFLRWFLAWLLYIPTLGLSWIWYRAGEFRYFAASTQMEGLNFRSTLSTARLILIGFIYLLTVVLLSVLALAALTGGDFSSTPIVFQMDQLEAMNPEVISAIIYFLVIVGVVMPTVVPVLYVHPLAKALIGSLAITGYANLEEWAQSAQKKMGAGEGLADALDIGSF
jgi:uncharacterized membrane protein YjgN (DUF898 family)